MPLDKLITGLQLDDVTQVIHNKSARCQQVHRQNLSSCNRQSRSLLQPQHKQSNFTQNFFLMQCSTASAAVEAAAETIRVTKTQLAQLQSLHSQAVTTGHEAAKSQMMPLLTAAQQQVQLSSSSAEVEAAWEDAR